MGLLRFSRSTEELGKLRRTTLPYFMDSRRTQLSAFACQVLALSLIFGGAIGNYIDRLRFGYVIDFLDFHLRDLYSWPAFNVADSTIVAGVCMLLLLMLVTKSPAKVQA